MIGEQWGTIGVGGVCLVSEWSRRRGETRSLGKVQCLIEPSVGYIRGFTTKPSSAHSQASTSAVDTGSLVS
jgi:hypothetical protein